MRDDQVEQAVRDSLERHAREADIDAPVAERAKAAAAGGPGTPRLLLVAAAVIAVVAGGVVVAQTRGGDGGDPVQPAPPAVVDAPADWRTESWHGVEVKVPPKWGWGGAPVDQDGSPLDCGVGQAGKVPKPYVGRPVYLTDACAMIGQDRPEPPTPYVWLGAPLSVGKVQLGDYTEETVEVAGTTVTVATDDPGLRAQILDTVRPAPAKAACAPELDKPPAPHVGGKEGLGPALGMTVCTYRKDGERLQLATAAEFGAAATRRLLRAAKRAPHSRCTTPRDSAEIVVIEARGTDKFGPEGSVNTERLVVHLGGECPQIVPGERSQARVLTRASVQEWAVGAVPVTLHGPAAETGEFAGMFIGILG